MTILIKNVRLLAEYGFGARTACVVVKDARIAYVGEAEPRGFFDRVIDGQGNLLMPAFYNTHCHAAMSLFRGYGEDLPLDRWLNERIFPAEDKLTSRAAYLGSLVSIAEMIASGVVSFSDMYMFQEEAAKAVLDTGVKANLSRCIVSFADMEDPRSDSRYREAVSLFREYHGESDDRILVDMSLHGEYTNTEQMMRTVAESAAENKMRIQMHISETRKEHTEAMARRGGRTPIRMCLDTGILDSPTTAAHCVWVSEEDLDIMKEKNVFVSHNPKSNLKLGSGVMPLDRMLAKGISVSFGTDGAASNNNLSVLSELQTAAILHKGIRLDPAVTHAEEMLTLSTHNGAMAQGREDCGRIKEGFRADLVLWNLNSIHNIPSYDPAVTMAYSAKDSDVLFTMSDGKILYENGEYQTIDVEKLKSDVKGLMKHYFD